jgi:hypothetical protein
MPKFSHLELHYIEHVVCNAADSCRSKAWPEGDAIAQAIVDKIRTDRALEESGDGIDLLRTELRRAEMRAGEAEARAAELQRVIDRYLDTRKGL